MAHNLRVRDGDINNQFATNIFFNAPSANKSNVVDITKDEDELRKLERELDKITNSGEDDQFKTEEFDQLNIRYQFLRQKLHLQ